MKKRFFIIISAATFIALALAGCVKKDADDTTTSSTYEITSAYHTSITTEPYTETTTEMGGALTTNIPDTSVNAATR